MPEQPQRWTLFGQCLEEKTERSDTEDDGRHGVLQVDAWDLSSGFAPERVFDPDVELTTILMELYYTPAG